MTDDEWRNAARYMLDTRTVNSIGEYVYFHRGAHAWGALLWSGVFLAAAAYGEPTFTGWVGGFCLGFWVCHFRGLLGLAQSNETLERFVDWPRVLAVASRSDDPSAAAASITK